MTKKLRDLTAQELCKDPDHSPGKTGETGVFEHICPACGQRAEFTVMPESYLAGKR